MLFTNKNCALVLALVALVGVVWAVQDYQAAEAEATERYMLHLASQIQRTPAPVEVEVEVEPAPAPAPKMSRFEREARIAQIVGLGLEALGKAAPAYGPLKVLGDMSRQAGVQVQIAAMADLDQLSHNPAIAGVQGFLVGL